MEDIEIDDGIRKQYPGQYIQLSDGITHYEVGGDPNGQKVVLVHGFSVPYFIWDPTFKFLTERGFHVLRYDLFGRGLSDRPKKRYDPVFFDTQLFELVTKLGFDKFSILGLSMGGAIVTKFVKNHPSMINSVILEDSAGVSEIKGGVPFFLKIPGVGYWIFSKIGLKTILERSPVNLYRGRDNPKFPEYQKKFMEQMKYKGVGYALFSTMLNYLSKIDPDDFKWLGSSDIPTLIIWGEKDEVISPPDAELIGKMYPKAIFKTIPNAGHSSNYENPEEFNRILLEFLNRA